MLVCDSEILGSSTIVDAHIDNGTQNTMRTIYTNLLFSIWWLIKDDNIILLHPTYLEAFRTDSTIGTAGVRT